MRAVWKGAVSFGLVSIPVKLYRATETRDVSFHQVRASDGSRVRYQRIAVADGEEVSYGEIAKGFELPSGETVILTDDDFADLPLTSSRSVEVEAFVPLEQVDPIYFDKTYYVEPDGSQALKPYALLRDALVDSGRVALVKVALRQREQLATLRVRDGLFVLETMIWPDEVRAADFAFLDEDIPVRSQELAMATSLIESLAADFDPSGYTDSYREAIEALVQSKIDGHEVTAAPGARDDGDAEVVDLMSALRASVAAAKKARGESDEPAAPADAPAADAAEPEASGGSSPAGGGGHGSGASSARAKPAAKAAAGRAPASKSAKAAPGKSAKPAKTAKAAAKAPKPAKSA